MKRILIIAAALILTSLSLAAHDKKKATTRENDASDFVLVSDVIPEVSSIRILTKASFLTSDSSPTVPVIAAAAP